MKNYNLQKIKTKENFRKTTKKIFIVRKLKKRRLVVRMTLFKFKLKKVFKKTIWLFIQDG